MRDKRNSSSKIWVNLGQRTPAVRVDLDNEDAFDFQIKTWNRNLRSAETDAERLEEETAETAKAEAVKRIALKRKAENDPSDSEVEDSAMNSLADLWHREDDPDSEVELLIFQQRDRHVASVQETGGDKPVCKEPKTPFPFDECGWDYIDDTSGKLLNNTLVAKARAEEISVIRKLGVWEVVDSLVRAELTSTKMTNTNRSSGVGWLCKSTNDKQIGHFHSRSTARGSAKFVDLCNT